MNTNIWFGSLSRLSLPFLFVLILSSPRIVFGASDPGHLQITVTNVDDNQPITGAQVTISDPQGIRPAVVIPTDAAGRALSPGLEPQTWSIRVTAPHFEIEKRQIAVTSGATLELTLTAEPLEETIKVASQITPLKPRNTSTSTSRNKTFSEKFPIEATNPQQLTGLMVSNPGMVQNSANQVHPRGEHSATSIYMNGFQLGGAAQGRFGPVLDPEVLESLEIMTGGFAPEFAGGAAILDTTPQSGTAKPFVTGEFGGGNFGNRSGAVSFGGQAGAPTGSQDKDGNPEKVLSYYVRASGRATSNALEAPQPGHQTAHNSGHSANVFGRFDLNPSPSDHFSLMLNASPAKTDVANRVGLPDSFAPYGQGFGFGGALSRAEAGLQGIVSQEEAGQDIYQKDENAFGVIQWRQKFSDQLSGLLSIGMDQSKLDTLNNNPEVDLGNLPADSSIEYDPTVRRDGKHKQVSGSVTYEAGEHSFKFGGQYSDESASDSYKLKPRSALALNALYATDPRLVPEGRILRDAEGNEVTDAQGNPVYLLSTGAESPTLAADTEGYYLAGYAQDTWTITESITANYGLRYDKFRQRQNTSGRSVDEDLFSPRVNLSWSFAQTWLARAAYNRLFIEPPLSQGGVIGDSIEPEKVHQYEASIEKELTPRQKAKLAWYYKDIRDQVDTGLLIPSTQLGVFTSVNLDRAAVHGTEFSYELSPDHGLGTSAYIAYAFATARPSGFTSLGEPVEEYNDHDQRHTLSSGVAYTFDNRYSIGATYSFGSGLASSVLTEDGSRQSRDRIDLSASTRPDLLFGKAGLKLSVSNLLDDRDLINFNSAFSGTRFQQGRTIYLGTFFTF